MTGNKDSGTRGQALTWQLVIFWRNKVRVVVLWNGDEMNYYSLVCMMGQLAKQCLVSIGMTTAKVDRVVTYCSKIKIYDMIIITLITQSNTLQILYNLSLVWYDIITYHKPQLIVTVSSSVVIACLFASNRLFHLTIKSRTCHVCVVITHSLSLSSSLYSSSSSAISFSPPGKYQENLESFQII